MKIISTAVAIVLLLSLASHYALTPGGAPQRWTEDPIGPPGWDATFVIKELSLEESAQRAGLIVVGRVQSQTGRKVPGSIVTDISLSVEKQLKGPAPASQNLTFSVEGGFVGTKRLYAGGQPQFVNGERVLLFLRSATDRQLVQMYTSRYTLAADRAVQPENKKNLPIAEVEARLTAALGQTASIGATQNTVTAAPFTTYCTPWLASQMPVPYYVNQGTIPPPPAVPPPTAHGTGALDGFPAFDVIYQALLLWQTQPNSATAFSIAGSSDKDGLNHDDLENTVAWANIDLVPFGGPGVIGLNYCMLDPLNGSRHDSDTLLTNNPTWSWDSVPGDGITANTISVKAVAAHELGHGLGLNHSDANCVGAGSVTPVMCAAIQIGDDKFAQPDDIAGATALYPLTGAPPPAPSGLTAIVGNATNTRLLWTAVAGAFAIDVERSAGGCAGPFRSINTVAGNASAYTDNNYGFGLPVGAAAFCYRVKALGTGGDSAYSNTATPQPAGPNPCAGGAIYKNSGGVWTNIPGAARQIAANQNNFWVIGTNAVAGGCGIYQYVGGAAIWNAISGGGTDIAVSNFGDAWVIQAGAGNAIYRYSAGVWTSIPGAAREISISSKGDVWALDSTQQAGGYGIYRFVGGAQVWQGLAGAAEHIAIAGDSSIWAVQTNGDIYHNVGGNWISIPGKATAITVSADDTVYALGQATAPGGFLIYKYVGGAQVWQNISGAAVDIAGGAGSDLYARQ